MEEGERQKNNEEETPWERRCLRALLAGTPAVPRQGQIQSRGHCSTVRQEVAFRGEVDYD